MQVAPATVAAARQLHALAQLGHVGQHGFFILIQNFSAHRHTQNDVIAIFARALFAHTGLTVLGEKVLLVAKINQRVQPVHSYRPNRAATAAITAIRPAKFDEFLFAERDTAAATGTGADVYFGEIEKLHVIS